jgi:hypothetical protein
MESVRHTITDEARGEELLRKFLRQIADMDFTEPPPAVARKVHRALRRECGVDDPYRDAKDRFTSMALDLLPSLEARIESSADPFDAAVRLAIAGNVIDLGVNGDLTEEDALPTMNSALDLPVTGDVGALAEAVRAARSILYLADNAGEDRLRSPAHPRPTRGPGYRCRARRRSSTMRLCAMPSPPGFRISPALSTTDRTRPARSSLIAAMNSGGSSRTPM